MKISKILYHRNVKRGVEAESPTAWGGGGRWEVRGGRYAVCGERYEVRGEGVEERRVGEGSRHAQKIKKNYCAFYVAFSIFAEILLLTNTKNTL